MASERVTIGEHVYIIETMSVQRTIHVVRKLLVALGGSFGKIRFEDLMGIQSLKDLNFDVEGLTTAIANMPEGRFDEITFDLLRTTRRESPTGVQMVMRAPGAFALADIDFSDVLELIAASLKLNWGNFRKSREKRKKASTPGTENIRSPEEAQPLSL